MRGWEGEVRRKVACGGAAVIVGADWVVGLIAVQNNRRPARRINLRTSATLPAAPDATSLPSRVWQQFFSCLRRALLFATAH